MASGSYKRCYSNQLNRKDLQNSPVESGIAISGPASGSRRRRFKKGVSLAEKFWAFVVKTPTCWLWTGALDKDGYGQIFNPDTKRPMKAHRLSWILHHGPIAADVHVLHRCDVRNCVAPHDLFEGNQDANMKDAAAKGRLSVARPRRRKLAPAEMQAILAAPESRGVVVRLAAQYGVTKAYVSLLRNGRRGWRAPAIQLRTKQPQFQQQLNQLRDGQ